MSVRLATSKRALAPRSPERETLAQAIQNHAALVAALAENATNAKRTEASRWEAHRKVDAAAKAVEEAKTDDAEAIAKGRAIGAAKAARAALTDCEDNLDAAKAAETMLAEQRTDLTTRLGIADSRVKAAIAAVVNSVPEVRELIEKFQSAQLAYHEMREAMQALSAVLPHPTNAEAWAASGLPRAARFWDNIDWQRELSPSKVAARVKAWIESLATDPTARLNE